MSSFVKNTCSIPARKLKGKRLLGRPRCRWQDNIEMNFNEIGYGVRNGFTWFGIGAIGGLLLTW